MSDPKPGEVWLVDHRSAHHLVAGIRSFEQDAWVALDRATGALTVLPAATPVRRLQEDPVPTTATWEERVQLLAQFDRPYAGAHA